MPTYANGRAPESALVMFDGVHVTPGVVSRLSAFFAYAAMHGHTLHVAKKYGGYRTLAEQAIVAAKGPSGGSTVKPAEPGFSHHGDYDSDQATDLVGANNSTYTTAELDWMVANSPHFGLVREFGARDPNHFIAVGSFAGGTVIPIGEDDMAKPEFLAWNNIHWPNGWFQSYPADVYVACKYFYDSGGYEQAGTEGTIAREIKHANAMIAALVTTAAAPAPVIDYDKLATALAAKMPPYPTKLTLEGTAS